MITQYIKNLLATLPNDVGLDPLISNFTAILRTRTYCRASDCVIGRYLNTAASCDRLVSLCCASEYTGCCENFIFTNYFEGLLCQRFEMAESQVRQNYHPESEAGVNKQINLELYAFYTYLSLV